jgi:predicted SprT family Zn-dependent metalloprotease
MSLTLAVVRELARSLLDVNGLADWSVRFSRSKLTLGRCLFDARAIEVSAHFVQHNGADAVRDTVLHEIAHALVGPGHGHDAAWRAMCQRVGARPERLSFEAVMPEGRWQAVCPGCGLRHHRYRRPKRMKGWFCARCGRERGKLAWEQTCIPDSARTREGRDALPCPRNGPGNGLGNGDGGLL